MGKVLHLKERSVRATLDKVRDLNLDEIVICGYNKDSVYTISSEGPEAIAILGAIEMAKADMILEWNTE